MAQVTASSRFWFGAALLAIGSAWAGGGLILPVGLTRNDVRSSSTYRTPDGGIDFYVAILKDGGALQVQRDGGWRVLAVRSTPCDVDAGSLLALLAQRSCDKSSDCAVVRPELLGSDFDCCYAVERTVAHSQSLDDEIGFIGRECGWATMTCMPGTCDRAVCQKGKCGLASNGSGRK